jgi:hypothetical protein
MCFVIRSSVHTVPPSLRGGERRGLGQRPISPVRKSALRKGRLFVKFGLV